MSNYEATKYDFDGANLSGIEGIPTATIVPWSSSSVPSGFLECNGQAVSRSTYADLFAIVGTTYGTGDGSSTFNVPDLQDNVAVGKSNNKSLGSTGGANTVRNNGNISGNTANATLSTPQLARHSHGRGGAPMQEGRAPNNLYNPTAAPGNTNQTGSGGGHRHNFSGNFSGGTNSVVQPYLTVIYIIKT